MMGWFLRSSVHTEHTRLSAPGVKLCSIFPKYFPSCIVDPHQRARLSRLVIDGLPQADRRLRIRRLLHLGCMRRCGRESCERESQREFGRSENGDG